MKVCFVVGTLGQGGAERQLVFMLRALLKCGISVRVLSLTTGEHFESDISKLGIPVEFVGKSNSRLRRLLLLARKLRSDRADVVQSTHFFTNLYVGLCGRLLGIPSIGAIRSDFVSEVAGHGFWGPWQVAAPKFFLTNSMSAYSNALDSGVPAHKIELVRNVVAASDTHPRAKSSTRVTILFVGRLDDNKRPEKFIYLARTLLRRHPDSSLRFLVAGDGPRRRELRELVDKLEISSHLNLLGGVSDIGSVYRDSHILVSTSRREGTPNVILEAMAHGLPVVATKAGGTAELLDGGGGILVDSDDDDGLADAVSSLIVDEDRRAKLGSEGRAYVERDHSIRYLENRLPEIYNRLIQNVSSN